MIVDNLLSIETPPLKPGDSVAYALGLLMEARVEHLPVVDDERHIVGILSEARLLDADGPEDQVGDLVAGTPVFVTPKDHVFEVARIMMEHDLTTVPVLRDDQYLGLVRRHDLFEWFARSLSTQAPGAILAIEVSARDYALSQLVYAIEQNDVKVLSIASEHPDPPSGNIAVTVKINSQDASRVKAMLEHRGYRVIATFGESEDDEDLLYRVQQFMRYLEV